MLYYAKKDCKNKCSEILVDLVNKHLLKLTTSYVIQKNEGNLTIDLTFKEHCRYSNIMFSFIPHLKYSPLPIFCKTTERNTGEVEEILFKNFKECRDAIFVYSIFQNQTQGRIR